jgi:hypothetical protein
VAQRHGELVKAVLNVLTLWGCLPFPVKQMATPRKSKRTGKMVWCRGQLKPGVADVIACSPSGRFVAVEVKTAEDKLRPEQVEFQSNTVRRNGIHLVCHDTVQALLDAKAEVMA